MSAVPELDLLGLLGMGLMSDIGTTLFSSAVQHHYQEKNLKNSTHEQRKLMHLQYLYQKSYDQNRPTWQRQGMEKAGYNAMLPFLGNGGGLNSGVVSAPSAPSGAPAGLPDFKASSAISNFATLKELQLKEKQLEAQTRLLDAQENKVKAETKTIKTTLPNKTSGNAVSNYLFGDGSGVDAVKGLFHSGLSDIINQSVPWAVSGYMLKKLHDRNNGPKDGPKGGSGSGSGSGSKIKFSPKYRHFPERNLKDFRNMLPLMVVPVSAGALMRGSSIGSKFLRPIFL